MYTKLPLNIRQTYFIFNICKCVDINAFSEKIYNLQKKKKEEDI